MNLVSTRIALLLATTCIVSAAGCKGESLSALHCGNGTHEESRVCVPDLIAGADPSGDSAGGDAASGDSASGDAASGDSASGDAASGDSASGDAAPGDTGGDSTSAAPGDFSTATSGDINILCYNVAGLPQGISGSDPATNIPLISPMLNNYDLALVQEDFAYHAELSADAQHPYQSVSNVDPGVNFGDGLNRFSQSYFQDFYREVWNDCNGIFSSGSDCLTNKGFSVALHTFASGVEVDIYNLHNDASSSPEDIAARESQVTQLVALINSRSAGRAVIVAGDTNMDQEDEATFVRLLNEAGLTDACRFLVCGDEFRIDRVLFRNSAQVELTPTSWMIDLSFVTSGGADLSDHETVAVGMHWQRL